MTFLRPQHYNFCFRKGLFAKVKFALRNWLPSYVRLYCQTSKKVAIKGIVSLTASHAKKNIFLCFSTRNSANKLPFTEHLHLSTMFEFVWKRSRLVWNHCYRTLTFHTYTENRVNLFNCRVSGITVASSKTIWMFFSQRLFVAWGRWFNKRSPKIYKILT